MTLRNRQGGEVKQSRARIEAVQPVMAVYDRRWQIGRVRKNDRPGDGIMPVTSGNAVTNGQEERQGALQVIDRTGIRRCQ